MEIFERYPGRRIPRRAYYDGVTKMVERFPMKVNINDNLVFFCL